VRAATSAQTFGGEGFRGGLETLADAEAGFTDMGKAALDEQIVDLLSSRLQVEDWYARHPAIEDEEIAAPLIGLGLPRAGSTALPCLLNRTLGP
jgi:hypothetical protein